MSTAQTIEQSGGCLCGAIRYETTGPLRPVVCCHCEQCRRTSGHYVAASAAGIDSLRLSGEGMLTWYRSSEKAERGFCRVCGSNIFWRPDHRRYVSIMAGTLDQPTGLATACHIYVDSAADYYELADDLPQHAGDYPDALISELE